MYKECHEQNNQLKCVCVFERMLEWAASCRSAGVAQLLLLGASVGPRQVEQPACARVRVAAQAGHRLVLFDIDHQLAAGGAACAREGLQREEERGSAGHGTSPAAWQEGEQRQEGGRAEEGDQRDAWGRTRGVLPLPPPTCHTLAHVQRAAQPPALAPLHGRGAACPVVQPSLHPDVAQQVPPLPRTCHTLVHVHHHNLPNHDGACKRRRVMGQGCALSCQVVPAMWASAELCDKFNAAALPPGLRSTCRHATHQYRTCHVPSCVLNFIVVPQQALHVYRRLGHARRPHLARFRGQRERGGKPSDVE